MREKTLRKALSALALTGASVLLLAACGSSGSDTTATITKAAFLKQGNAICANGNKEIDQASKNLGQNGEQPSQAQLEKFVNETVLPSVEKQVAALEALPVPSGDEDQVQAILDAANQGIDQGKQDPTSLTGNSDPFAKASQLANEYGLTECGG